MAKPDEVIGWLRAYGLHHIGGLFQELMVIADDLSDLSAMEEEDICKVADALSMKLANRKDGVLVRARPKIFEFSADLARTDRPQWRLRTHCVSQVVLLFEQTELTR
jgi:hypothetical protein